MGRIAQLLGADVHGLSREDAAEAGIAAVEQLRTEIGIPQRIRDLNGKRKQLAGFAEKAFAIKRLMWINPRQPSQEDLLGILEAAY